MNRAPKSLILWLCIACLGFVASMDLPSVPTYIPSAPDELDDLPELSVLVGGQHLKGLYRLGSWNMPLYYDIPALIHVSIFVFNSVNKAFMKNPFKTGSFAILRREIQEYDEAAGLFNIQVAFDSKEKGLKMLETIIQFFSEYGPFHFKDILIGVSYNKDVGECFILKFRDQVFIDEVYACIGNVLAKSFTRVFLKKVKLGGEAVPYFTAADLLPLQPLKGPAWKLYSHGQLIEELQRFSQVMEYIHFIGPADIIPGVSLCRADYEPGESAAVQLKITIKGMMFQEQARNIYLLFSYLLPEIQGSDGNVMLKKFLHMKLDLTKSSVDLYLSFSPDVDVQELKKEINSTFFRVLIKNNLAFSFDWFKFKTSTFAIEGSAPKECHIPDNYRLFMREYFRGDKKKSAILKFHQEPAEVKCLIFFKASFKLDASIHIDRLFFGLYDWLGRHEYDKLEGFHLSEIKLSPIGSKDDFSIQLAYANMNHNYGTIVELFTALLRGCGIQSIPYAKILKNMRPGTKEVAISVPASVETYTSSSITFDTKETGAVPSLLAAFDKLSETEKEAFKTYFPEEITAIVKTAEANKIVEVPKEEEIQSVKPQVKPKPTLSKKQAKKYRAANSSLPKLQVLRLDEEPEQKLEPVDMGDVNPEPIAEVEPVEAIETEATPDEKPVESEPKDVGTPLVKTKKIKASKKRRIEAREKVKKQKESASIEVKPETTLEMEETKTLSLQDLIEDLVGDKQTQCEPAIIKDEPVAAEPKAEAKISVDIKIAEIEKPKEKIVVEPEIEKASEVISPTGNRPVLSKSYADALLGRETFSDAKVEEQPRSCSPIIGPILEPSIIMGPAIQSTEAPVQSDWYPSPMVVVTPKGSGPTFAYNAGTWDMYRGSNVWWSPFWQQHLAIHVIRKTLYTTPRPSIGPKLVSLVIAVPEHACDHILENVLAWIDSDPSAYIRHRTLSVSLLGSRFNLLPETRTMSYLVFTLRYPDDPIVSAWINACAHIIKPREPLSYEVITKTMFAPTQLSDMAQKEVPLNFNLHVAQRWTMIYNGFPAFDSENLIAITNALKCLGPQRFVPFGVVHRALPPGELLQLDYSRTVSIAPAPGLTPYSISALFNFFLRALGTVELDIGEPVESWMIPVLAHLECFYFTPVPHNGIYALNLQFDQFAPPELIEHAHLLAANWSLSLCQLKYMKPLRGKRQAVDHLERVANFQYAKHRSQPLPLGDLATLLRAYVNDNPLQVIPEAMVIEFGRSSLNLQPKPRWILSQVCFTDMPVAKIIHFITELYYLPRWSLMIGLARRVWVKRISTSQYIVGFATEDAEGAMENIPILTETMVINSLLVAVTDVHVSQPLETMEELEAAFAATIVRMTETSRRINDHIQSIAPQEDHDLCDPEVVNSEVVTPVTDEKEEDTDFKQPKVRTEEVMCEQPANFKVPEDAVPEQTKQVLAEPEDPVITEPEEVIVAEIEGVLEYSAEKNVDPITIDPIAAEEVAEKPVEAEVVDVWPKTLSTRINFRGVSLDCSYTLEEALDESIPSSIESEDIFQDVSKLIASLPSDFFSSGKFLTISKSDSDLADCVSLHGSIPTSDTALETALKIFESTLLSGEVPIVSVQIGPHGDLFATFQLALKPSTTMANIISIKRNSGKSIRWSTSW